MFIFISICIASAARLQNPDFEVGSPGEKPSGWSFSNSAQAELSLEGPAEGKQFLRLKKGALSQSLSVAELAGKRIRVNFKFRSADPGVGEFMLSLQSTQGQLWFETLEVWKTGWQDVQLLVDVPFGEELELNLRAALKSGQFLDVDAASIDIIGPVRFGDSPPAPLSLGAAERISAFTRLYGYTRWFHPSDENLKSDWNKIAVKGVELAEGESNAEELAKSLEGLLKPAAPGIQVWTGQNPPLSEPEKGDRSVAWHHLGPGVVNASHDPSHLNQNHSLASIYRRFRIDDQDYWHQDVEREYLIKTIDARSWRNETVILEAEGQLEGKLDSRILLNVRGSSFQAESPNIGGAPVSMLLAIPANADELELRIALKGKGSLSLNKLSIEPVRTGAFGLLVSSAGSLGLRVLLYGSLALSGAMFSRRTVGGFILALVGVILMSQMSQYDPSFAYFLPQLHMENLEARWTGDAVSLAQIEGLMGGPVRHSWSLLIFAAWIFGLLGIAALKLKSMDIRGGGD